MQIIQHTFGGNSSEPTFKLIMYFHLRFERVYKNPEQTLSYGKISYILSGTGEYTQGDVTVPMKKGDLLIINPYTPHIESSSENDPIEHLYFYFNSSVFDDKQPNKHNAFFSDDDVLLRNRRRIRIPTVGAYSPQSSSCLSKRIVFSLAPYPIILAKR